MAGKYIFICNCWSAFSKQRIHILGICFNHSSTQSPKYEFQFFHFSPKQHRLQFHINTLQGRTLKFSNIKRFNDNLYCCKIIPTTKWKIIFVQISPKASPQSKHELKAETKNWSHGILFTLIALGIWISNSSQWNPIIPYTSKQWSLIMCVTHVLAAGVWR